MPGKAQRSDAPASGDDVDRFIAQRAVESPDIDTEGMAIFGRIYRIATRIAPHMDALFAHHGLERGEFDVLATLQRSGPPYRLSPTALYTSLMVSSGGLTHRLKRLEAAGLVERVPSPTDGRSLIVALTDEGQRRTRAAFEADMQLQRTWLDALPADQRRTLADLLRTLGRAIPSFDKTRADGSTVDRERGPPG
ncbi:MarR family transcriptional regulator [Luteimonas sp. BDR2-5]|uniref:MarR family winged helix-turn-helix transcriptional regulator n=1 Tax=Proluteimonas luteida TaxID=2878685 RepID=UPI001E57C1D4|nr:MarR family transcriptional regulator [Luteimonas sp. BDR2-5]MCD9028356.1 MarR family transcriptional regulator [Luteimonas sp. BDR2-5]